MFYLIEEAVELLLTVVLSQHGLGLVLELADLRVLQLLPSSQALELLGHGVEAGDKVSPGIVKAASVL